MTKEEYLLALLRASLWQGKNVPIGNSQQLSGTLTLAREHTVEALVAHPFIVGQAQLATEQGDVGKRHQLVMQMMQVEQAHKVMYAKFSHLLHELASLFHRHGIRYVVFKGFAVASHYPQHYLRAMGDVDFYVVPEDFDQARNVIELEWNVVVERDNLDKHDSFSYQRVRFEMHRRIETFGRASTQIDFDRWIATTVSRSCSAIDIDDEHLAVLPPLADVVVVFKHLFNHLLVEGVGLRQVADLAMLLEEYKDVVDKETLRAKLHDLGYMRAFDVMVAMLHAYLGLACAEAYAPLTKRNTRYADRMYKLIMESGNFGRKAYAHHVMGWMKSLETAHRAFYHCLFAFQLIPVEIIAFVPRRIVIALRKYLKKQNP